MLDPRSDLYGIGSKTWLTPLMFCMLTMLFVPPARGSDQPPRLDRTWQPVGKPDLQGFLLREQGGAVVLQTSRGPVTIAREMLGVDDLKYVQNVHDAAAFRIWHFDHLPAEMDDWPHIVNGSFVRVVCEDLQFSVAVVELIDSDYHRRYFPLKALAEADQQLAKKLQAEYDAKRPSAVDRPYESVPTQYHPGDPGIHTAETPHFVFYWGDDHNGSGKIVFDDPTFIPRNQAWFEKVWDFFDRQMHAPMPMADQPKRHKINVYITGTGLKNHKEGFAFGAEEVVISPAAMGPGSSVISHEFTHTIQFYTGGLRDNPLVGWMWETHADWSCHQFMPGYPDALGVYFERQHYELTSSRMNYGSWPFLQYMGEDPRIGTGFCYDFWRDSLRSPHGHATEDPLQAIMRLGAVRGFFAGDGVQGFGDIIGQVASHDVDWDYASKYFYNQVWRDELQHFPTVNRTRTLLQPVPDRPGFFRPIFSHAPREFGVNLVDLIAAPSARTVSLDFQGIVDENESSDWRITLVATDAHGESRYSREVHGGKLSMELQPGDRALTLAIAATPDVYKPQPFRPGYGKKPRFPYEVSFTNCTPVAAPPQMREPTEAGHRHPNGGGFVADTASVAASAYVGSDARVLEGATVRDSARVEDHAIISGQASVQGQAIVNGWAHVMDQAVVKEQARVRGCAVVKDHATIAGQARVLEYVCIQGNGVIHDQATIKGFGEVFTSADAPLGGYVVCGEDLELYMGGNTKPLESGLVYGFTNADIISHGIPDSRGLYAHWDFTQPRKTVLKDSFADNQGVLRGNPRFVNDDGHAALSLNGRNQYAMVEGQVADSACLTIDAWVKWNGGSQDQSVFDFGSSSGNIGFTPSGTSGKPALKLDAGDIHESLTAKAKFPIGRWVRVTVSLGSDADRLFIDGAPAAEIAAPRLTPDNIPVTCGYLGRRFAGGGFFSGLLGDFAVYRKTTPDADAVSALSVPVVAKVPQPN
jgi:carbonic anhydrase/acetyltransferase-like protein (isoleucine patch superfamily)